MAEYVKRSDWPFGRSNFSVADVLAWLRENITRGKWSSGPNPVGEASEVARKRQIDMLYKAEQTALIRQRREMQAGKLIPREEGFACALQITNVIRARLDEWAASLPPLISSEQEEQERIRALLEVEHDRLCDDMEERLIGGADLATEEEVAAWKDARKQRAAWTRHRTAK